jgi:hypothetical protein
MFGGGLLGNFFHFDILFERKNKCVQTKHLSVMICNKSKAMFF